jgi:ABC-2 type transport system permease protein
VLALPLALAAAVAVAAYLLAARRDHGSGLLRPRPGPAAGGAALTGPLGLAWRLHRGALLGWTVAVAIGWSLTGAVARTIRSLLRGQSAFQEALAKLAGQSALVNDFFVAIMGLAGLVVAGYAISAVLRLRSEESAERAEPLLATPTGRIRWAASHLVVALGGSVFLLTVAGLAAGLGYGIPAGDAGGWAGRLIGAALGQLPAALAVTTVAVALFGLAPEWAVGGGWAAFVFALVLVLLGPVLNLSHWIVDVSPFVHSPKLPGGQLAAAPVIWLTAVAAALTAAGQAGLRRRDIG